MQRGNRNTSGGSDSGTPFISIITVVRNGETLLRRTIRSIRNQDYPDIEYIIIDGASSDGTLEIIKQNEDIINIWISERDEGIYDAMNKGLLIAKGQWVNFMNAGDEFNDNRICTAVAEHAIKNSCDVIYGDVLVKNNTSNSQMLLRAKPLDKIWYGMIFSHQSAFVKRSELIINPFDLKYRLASDFNQMLGLYLQDKKFSYLPIVIANVIIGGLSYSNSTTIKEELRIVHSYKPFSPKLLYFSYLYLLATLKKLLGSRIMGKIREIRWKYSKLQAI